MSIRAIEFKGIYCKEYIPWIIFGAAAAVALFSYNYFTLWFLLLLGFISLVKMVKCKFNSPELIAVIENDVVTVNFEKTTIRLGISEIEVVVKKWNSVLIKKKNNEGISINATYFLASDDINSFITTINNMVSK